jgi:hypothetical protein
MSYDPRTTSAQEIHELLGAGAEQHQPYPTNPEAVEEIKRRIAETAKKRGMITYSNLVRGIKFQHPERGPDPFEIITFDWKGWDRKFIGAILAQITCDTILETGCVTTTIVVDSISNEPSKILFSWLESIGVIPDGEMNTVLAFWAHHLKLTHEYFKTRNSF